MILQPIMEINQENDIKHESFLSNWLQMKNLSMICRQQINKMAAPISHNKLICRQKTRWWHQFVNISIYVGRKQDGRHQFVNINTYVGKKTRWRHQFVNIRSIYVGKKIRWRHQFVNISIYVGKKTRWPHQFVNITIQYVGKKKQDGVTSLST